MLHVAEFWVAVAFVMLLAGLWYLGAHRSILESLDARADRIRIELEEARRLRQEAADLLEEYKRKRQEAEAEAAAIIAQAKEEAETIAKESEARTQEFLARRARQAETRIAQAEADALAEVRAAAAEAAVKAAEQILADSVKGGTADGLITAAIKDIKARLDR